MTQFLADSDYFPFPTPSCHSYWKRGMPQALEVRAQSQLSYLFLAVSPWTSHQPLSAVRFLFCKTRITTVLDYPIGLQWGLSEVLHAQQWLSQNKQSVNAACYITVLITVPRANKCKRCEVPLAHCLQSSSVTLGGLLTVSESSCFKCFSVLNVDLWSLRLQNSWNICFKCLL